MPRLIAAVLLVLLAPAGCAINPVSGRPELVLTTVEGEVRRGRALAEEIERAGLLLTDSPLTHYTAALGARLAEGSPRRDVAYAFRVVDLVEPNAFALPGGFVYVSRGLLPLLNSEDELAGVLGHEIAHVAARHDVQREVRRAPFAIATGVGAGALGVVSPALGRLTAGLGGLARATVLAPYDRGQEREADRVGQEIAADGGWDPGGLAAFLRTLDRESQLDGQRAARGSFLATHPSTPERVAAARQRAGRIARAPHRPLAAGRTAFLHHLEGLLVGPDPAQGVFEEELFLHPDLDFALRFPADWQVHNARDFVAAVLEKQAALVLELQERGDDPEAAARAFLERSGLDLGGVQSLQVGGRPAARATGTRRRRGVHLTWIAHGGNVYRLAGVCSARDFEGHAQRFAAAASSFRALTEAQRARIRETRLRLVPARAGETLGELLARARSEWDAPRAAVANGIEPDATLRQGQLLKVPVAEPYVARRSAREVDS